MWGLSPEVIQSVKSTIWAAPFVAACVMGYIFLEHLTMAAEDEAKRDAVWLVLDKAQHAEFMKAFDDQSRELATQSYRIGVIQGLLTRSKEVIHE